MALFIFGQAAVNAFYCWIFLKLFMAVDVDGTFPMRQFMHHLDMRFKSYKGLRISAWVWACCQPLSMQQILPKTAKICKNLPNEETLKYHQKSRF
jgi:hypothetical protein